MKSPLFWKIVGIYLLLSTLALGGLVLTLSQTLERNARHDLEADARQLLLAIRDTQSGLINMSQLRAMRRSPGQSLYLCDAEGQLIDTDIAEASEESSGLIPELSVRRILIRNALKKAVVLQWDVSLPGTLLGAVRLRASDETVFVLLSKDESKRFTASSTGRHSAVQAAIVAWLCGTVCFAFVAATVVGPTRMLLQVMGSPEESLQRRELLMTLSERTDEFGDVARALVGIDFDRQEHLAELQKQEVGLRSTATQLSAILQAMADGVIAVDQSEKILFANKVACRLMMLDDQTIEGRPVFEMVRNRHLHEAVNEALTRLEEVTVEFRVTQSNRDVSLVVSPIPDRGAVLVFHDTTELRKLESMRRNFVSGVSHELKTPLTVIQACTETLLDGAVEDLETARTFLQQIDEQSERLLQLVLGMLQLARVESGAQVLSEKPVDLRAVAETTLKSLRPVAKGRDITLSLKGEDELYVLGDYQALLTVTGSLVDNAIKYTPAGGWVSIEVVSEENTSILRVADNGVGIPMKDQVRVFERFYRVERDRNREQGGTGLGLAIVKHLCQAMNANIALQSDAGQGCIFEVQFPVKEE